MERLTSVQTIEHIDGTSHEQIYCFGHLWGPAFFKKGTKDYEEYLSIVKRLAEYEDLEEQGKLLKLPCAVGDTVYSIDDAYGILEYKVEMISICETVSYECAVHSEAIGDCPVECIDEIWPENEDFGKTVFLTREEAETALKGEDEE